MSLNQTKQKHAEQSKWKNTMETIKTYKLVSCHDVLFVFRGFYFVDLSVTVNSLTLQVKVFDCNISVSAFELRYCLLFQTKKKKKRPW